MTKLTDIPGASEALPTLQPDDVERIEALIDSGYWDSSDLEDIDSIKRILCFCRIRQSIHLEVDVEAMIELCKSHGGDKIDERLLREMLYTLSLYPKKWERLVRK